jgi:hypothetical protein
MKKLPILIAATILIYALTVPVHASLIDRGNGLIYDDDLNLTWLQDANYSGLTMTWPTAMAWADNLTFQGFDDWRLPASDACSGNGCSGSEMGHLFYNEGTNSDSSGLFQNVKPSIYWSASEDENDPSQSWRFSFKYGTQGVSNEDTLKYAWAVRTGDVTPPVAPEPVSSVLFLAGGTVLAARRYRRKMRKG